MNNNNLYDKLTNYYTEATKYHKNGEYKIAEELYKDTLRICFSIYDSTQNSEEKEELADIISRINKNLKKCTGIHLDNVRGLDEYKELIRKNIFSVVRNQDTADEYGVKANCCILLQGKPGTGKSFAVKAAVNEFPEAELFEVRTSSLIDAYIGNTGKNIDALFEKAKKYIGEYNNRYAIIFIDEVDGIARSRTSDDKGAKEAMSSLLVNLTKIDEENLNIIFIAATNTPDQLDAAFLSRFGNNIIEFPLPNEEARKMMLLDNLRKMDEKINWPKIIKMTEGLSGRDLKFIANDANKLAFNQSVDSHKEVLVDEGILIEVISLAIARKKIKRSYL